MYPYTIFNNFSEIDIWTSLKTTQNIIRRANMKKSFSIMVIVLFVVAVFVGAAVAQDFVVYPAEGQSNEQMEKDKFECYSWAKGQSGFDPMQMPTASSPAPPKGDKSVAGGVVGGGVLGGAGGAIIGGIAGGKKGAKKGALIGGLTGGTIGGMRSGSQNKQADAKRKQWEQEQANQYMQKRNLYNRNFAACMEGKGYSVK
jgi:outer membrane lipoprotein SlyB